MSLARGRRRDTRIDYWPGFVDAMATLLLVIIFLLSVFMLSQFFLTREITGKDTALSRLNSQIAELTELLALERAGKREVEDQVGTLRSSLTAVEGEKGRLQGLLEQQAGAASSSSGAVETLGTQLDDEKRVSARALAQVELLNQQISALRRQIAALETALDASESRDRESQTKISDLGKRLNVALAQRVQELQRYRSDFFGRLREILGSRSDIRVVGDRFVFQSEVLFPVGQETINDAGRADLDKLALAILELERQIPTEVAWTLRVDGHTDVRPTSSTGRFRSNWELSAARAISVVRYLIDRGVSPKRLVAAGFGEYQPLEEGASEEIYAKNRRIEIRMTDR
ncbi:peptidoglycan -binding protein [Prosthecodimorpha staleyi]|jgi:chemotaxis protein MotB|uniref:Peptidoglycan -binding protein n=1 Tax=Prosthecodimorpha staleyi TaxID=2840188 RepID=A0A947D201_9HYPH|nr:peptidoglycan -binding protein [Prosthecodimorpha staleyi]MBT9288818.1 peptidoglycan -binding protein [Prosthecodimorpha staleyi]